MGIWCTLLLTLISAWQNKLFTKIDCKSEFKIKRNRSRFKSTRQGESDVLEVKSCRLYCNDGFRESESKLENKQPKVFS